MFTRSKPLIVALAAMVLAGCAGRELGSADFEADGTLDWSTKVELACSPELWLKFELSAPAKDGADGLEPVFELPGTLKIQMNDQQWYDGEMALSSEDGPTRGIGRTLVGGSTRCNRKTMRCKASGKLRAFNLHHIRGGSKLHIKAKLPMKTADVQVTALRMELRN